MHETLSLAAANGGQAGAHRTFPDPWGFGPRPIHGQRHADIETAGPVPAGAARELGRGQRLEERRRG
ncbi:LamB/YcsF family protein, partial [Methylobacterium radiotolerans]|uniref:LamB/YcsF family protein n=1 Tax=Methylobacterium radiotolerans TaxID=31998 RepID=UPI0015C5E92C